jgi:hypothetical protein
MTGRKFGNDKDVAEKFGIGLQTLRNWRSKRQGPPYMKVHRRVVYDLEESFRWFKEREVRPEE